MAEFYIKNTDNKEIIRVGTKMSKWTIAENNDVSVNQINNLTEKELSENFTKISREKFQDVMLKIGFEL
jgi:hypothetical protein